MYMCFSLCRREAFSFGPGSYGEKMQKYIRLEVEISKIVSSRIAVYALELIEGGAVSRRRQRSGSVSWRLYACRRSTSWCFVRVVICRPSLGLVGTLHVPAPRATRLCGRTAHG